MNRREILLQAADITEGDREADYGSWADNARDIAAMWSVILGHAVKPHHVALCMAALKMVRLKRDSAHIDSWVDLCGYGALGGEDD